MGFLPKDLAKITCEMQGCTLTELRANKILLGCFCATLKDSGTLYERIANAVTERGPDGKKKAPLVNPAEVEQLCIQWRGTSAAREFAERFADRCYVIWGQQLREAAQKASAAAIKGNATKRAKRGSAGA